MSQKSTRAGTLLRRIAERRNAIRAGLGEFVVALKTAMHSLDTAAEPKAAAPSEPVLNETVPEILAVLGEGNLIIHDVSCQFGKLDYVVLSRHHGLFLIKTKAHTGRVAIVDSKIRINGSLPEEDLISQALHISYWLVEELRTVAGVDVEAAPLIVFPEAVVEANRGLKGVSITSKDQLLARIREGETPLPAPVWEAREKIADLFAAAAHR